MRQAFPTRRLRYLADVNPPVPGHVRLDPEAEYRLLPMEAIHEFSPPDTGYKRPALELLSGYSYIEPTDVAYAKVTPCFENGKGLVGADLEEPVFATTEVTVLRPRDGANQRFLSYVVQSATFRNPAISSMTGAGGLKRVSDSYIKDLHLPAPSIYEQQQIADYLDHETAEIDAFIMDLDSFISLLHESLGAIRSELFGLPTTHEAISLKRLARQVSGSGFPHDYQGDPAQEIPFFKVGSLKDSVDGKLTNSPNTVSTSTAKALGAMILPENTVVLAKIGAALFLNRTARLGKPSCIDNNMLGLIPRPSVNPEFLQGIISNMDLVPLGNPGAVPSLNMAWYREQPAWLPSYTNQQEIVETYRGKKDDISSLITGANRAIDLAHERRAALITAAVTGQIDVTAKNKPAAEQIEDDVAQGLHREYA
ncbi:restriction endonuclease subunit S [Kocuria sp. MNB10]